MKKSFSKLLVCLLSLSLASCGGNEEGGVTKLSFFSWGNETETKLNEELVAQFNEIHKGEIEVKFTPVPSGDYETKINNVLRGRNVPDVIIAGDGEIKPWIEQGGIEPLDSYVANSFAILSLQNCLKCPFLFALYN